MHSGANVLIYEHNSLSTDLTEKLYINEILWFADICDIQVKTVYKMLFTGKSQIQPGIVAGGSLFIFYNKTFNIILLLMNFKHETMVPRPNVCWV